MRIHESSLPFHNLERNPKSLVQCRSEKKRFQLGGRIRVSEESFRSLAELPLHMCSNFSIDSPLHGSIDKLGW